MPAYLLKRFNPMRYILFRWRSDWTGSRKGIDVVGSGEGGTEEMDEPDDMSPSLPPTKHLQQWCSEDDTLSLLMLDVSEFVRLSRRGSRSLDWLEQSHDRQPLLSVWMLLRFQIGDRWGNRNRMNSAFWIPDRLVCLEHVVSLESMLSSNDGHDSLLSPPLNDEHDSHKLFFTAEQSSFSQNDSFEASSLLAGSRRKVPSRDDSPMSQYL